MTNDKNDETTDIVTNLYLSTYQIALNQQQVSVSNLVGGWENGRKDGMYFNVNMRTLLGKQYDTYDFFIISFVNAFFLNQGTLSYGRGFRIDIGGLNWVNSSYDQADKANSYWAVVTNVALPASGTSGANTASDNYSQALVFRKGDPSVTIYFRFIDILTNASPTIVGSFTPSLNMLFKIKPIK